MDKRFGFIHDEMDIKVLILFILRRLSDPVVREKLIDVTLLCDDGIGYFEFSECLADLVKTEHVIEDDNKYTITDKGRQNGEATESGLPYSVRMRAERAATALSRTLRRDSLINASHEVRRRGGFNVKLEMSDGLGPVIKMELLANDDKQAKKMEDNFRQNAESVYLQIAEMLLN